jgi:nicotinate-nucleotide adenylyltransferase
MLRDERFDDPLFLIGADEFCDFPAWKDPDGVLELTRLGVATRPGYPEGRIQSVLDRLEHPERVEFFEIEPHPVASRDLRERLRRGQTLDGLVPARVAELIRERGLYRRGSGLH